MLSKVGSLFFVGSTFVLWTACGGGGGEGADLAGDPGGVDAVGEDSTALPDSPGKDLPVDGNPVDLLDATDLAGDPAPDPGQDPGSEDIVSDPGGDDLVSDPGADSGGEDVTGDPGTEPGGKDLVSDPGCVPNCNNKECSDDGCGGVCGVCGENFVCQPDQTCACTGSYELDAGVCVPLAEYVVKDLGADGRYVYQPTIPRQSNIRDTIWEGYPFRGIDAAFRIETPDGYWAEVFTYGDQYILLHDGTWKSCPDTGDCSASVPGPSSLCPGGVPDAYWGTGFPFCDGIDSITQLGVGDSAVFVATRGTQYVQWSGALGYHNWSGGSPAPGPGTIGDTSWGGSFPFTGIDALVDYHHDGFGIDRLLIVSGLQALDCSFDMTCGPVFEMGSVDDTFFPYLWQTLPFAKVDGWETPVDAIIRSGSSGRDLFISSNTPLPRLETSGEFRVYESLSGPAQRALVLAGTATEQGFTQGYHLGEEVVAILNEILIPFYNDTIQDPVAIAGGKTGYQAARELVTRFAFTDDLAVYVEELQGMLDGIKDNLATNRQLFDGAEQWTLDLTDLIAMQLVDDLWGTHCKSAMVWPEGGVTVPHPFHISIIDWDTTLGPYNLVVAYDNSDDAGRMSWIGPSWSGNVAGFLFGLNEAGAVYSYVSSGGELRRCPDGSGPCLDQRFADLEGMPLHSTAFVTRRSFELAGTIDEAWALLDGVTTMTVSSFAMTEPTNGTESGAVFEIVYPGIVDLWGSGYGYGFNEMTRPNQFLHHAPVPGDGGAFVPVLASVATHLGIVDIPGGESVPAYVALRDGLAGLYPAGVDTAALIDIVDDEPVFAPHTTQITIGEVIVGESGNQSVIDVFFSGLDGHNVWGEGASHGQYTWSDFLEP